MGMAFHLSWSVCAMAPSYMLNHHSDELLPGGAALHQTQGLISLSVHLQGRSGMLVAGRLMGNAMMMQKQDHAGGNCSTR